MIDLFKIFKEEKDPEAVSSMDTVKDFIEEEFERRLDFLMEAFRTADEKEIEMALDKSMRARRAREALKKAPKERIPVYLTDYRFLKGAYHFLTETQNEGFCLVTGPELDGNLFTLSRRLEPRMKRQSVGGAEPDFGSLSELLSQMDEKEGNRLTAYFHSHPGAGKAATRPSGIDKSTQARLERGGYPVIGAIFSRDGHLRFFAHRRRFQIKVSGKGGEQIDSKLFKVSQNKVKKVG